MLLIVFNSKKDCHRIACSSTQPEILDDSAAKLNLNLYSLWSVYMSDKEVIAQYNQNLIVFSTARKIAIASLALQLSRRFLMILNLMLNLNFYSLRSVYMSNREVQYN